MQDWVTRASFRLDALSVGKDKAADDRDWSRREAAVKALRAFVKKVEAAFVLSTQLISGGETDPVEIFETVRGFDRGCALSVRCRSPFRSTNLF